MSSGLLRMAGKYHSLRESIRQWRRVPRSLHLARAKAVLKGAPIMFGLPMTACDLEFNIVINGLNEKTNQSVIKVRDIENKRVQEALLKQGIERIIIEAPNAQPAAIHSAQMLIILKRAALGMEKGKQYNYLHPYSKLIGGVRLVKEGQTLKVSEYNPK